MSNSPSGGMERISPDTLVYYYSCHGCGESHGSRSDADTCCEPPASWQGIHSSTRCLLPASSAPHAALNGKAVIEQASIADFTTLRGEQDV
jgi:hypothetical protein